MATDHVAISTNPKTRESRLFPSMGSYVRRNAVAIARIYAQYEPLRVFMTLALIATVAALIPFTRFVVAYVGGNGAGHVQSLIFGAVLFNAAVVLFARHHRRPALRPADHVPGDFERIRRIELQLDVPPSHYEPGARPTRHPATTGAKAGQKTEEREAVESVSSDVTVDREGTVTGNTYDKYGSTNPVVRRLMAGFEGTLQELFTNADAQSLLDVAAAARACSRTSGRCRWARRSASSASTSTTRTCTHCGRAARRRTSSTG